jgi:hypothetical protein
MCHRVGQCCGPHTYLSEALAVPQRKQRPLHLSELKTSNESSFRTLLCNLIKLARVELGRTSEILVELG